MGHIEAGKCFSSKSEGERPPSQQALQQSSICAHCRNQHRDKQERDVAFNRESECARNAVESSSPGFSRECAAIWRTSCKASARCTSMSDETRCTFEDCKTHKIVDIFVSNRPCVREGESSEQ